VWQFAAYVPEQLVRNTVKEVALVLAFEKVYLKSVEQMDVQGHERLQEQKTDKTYGFSAFEKDVG